MGKIEIEYCGGWGYGGPAKNLKASLAIAFSGVLIDCHSAGGKTSKIEVSWIDGGKKTIVWSKGRADTDNSHQEIAALIKKQNWLPKN